MTLEIEISDKEILSQIEYIPKKYIYGVVLKLIKDGLEYNHGKNKETIMADNSSKIFDQLLNMINSTQISRAELIPQSNITRVEDAASSDLYTDCTQNLSDCSLQSSLRESEEDIELDDFDMDDFMK